MTRCTISGTPSACHATKEIKEMDWKDSIIGGLLSGVIWGVISMAVNTFTGAAVPEATFAHDIATFVFAGAVFGIVTGAFLKAAGGFIPVRSTIARAVIVSTSLWIVLRVAGEMLSAMEPDRYHFVTPQTIQGFVLSVLLGVILGVVFRKPARKASLLR